MNEDKQGTRTDYDASRCVMLAQDGTGARVAFVGDVTVPPRLDSHVRFDGPWVGNLEGPVKQIGRPIPGKIAVLSAGLEGLRTLGRLPEAFGMANNHVMDYGLPGFDGTIEEIRRAGVRWFGAGTREDNYANPLVIACGDSRIAVIG